MKMYLISHVWFFLCVFLVTPIALANDGQKEILCADPECTAPISYANALLQYNHIKKYHTSFKKGERMAILQKPVPEDEDMGLWYACIIEQSDIDNKIKIDLHSNTTRCGLVPSNLLKEFKKFHKNNSLLRIPAVLGRKNDVPEKTSDQINNLKVETPFGGLGVAAEIGDQQPPSTPYEVVDGTTLYVELSGNSFTSNEVKPIAPTSTKQAPSLDPANVHSALPLGKPSMLKESEDILDDEAEEEDDDYDDEGDEDLEDEENNTNEEVGVKLAILDSLETSSHNSISKQEINIMPTHVSTESSIKTTDIPQTNIPAVTETGYEKTAPESNRHSLMSSFIDIDAALNTEPGKSPEVDEMILKQFSSAPVTSNVVHNSIHMENLNSNKPETIDADQLSTESSPISSRLNSLPLSAENILVEEKKIPDIGQDAKPKIDEPDHSDEELQNDISESVNSNVSSVDLGQEEDIEQTSESQINQQTQSNTVPMIEESQHKIPDKNGELNLNQQTYYDQTAFNSSVENLSNIVPPNKEEISLPTEVPPPNSDIINESTQLPKPTFVPGQIYPGLIPKPVPPAANIIADNIKPVNQVEINPPQEDQTFNTMTNVVPPQEENIVNVAAEVPPQGEQIIDYAATEAPPQEEQNIYNSTTEAPPQQEQSIYNPATEVPPQQEQNIYNSATEAPPQQEQSIYNPATEVPPQQEQNIYSSVTEAPPQQEQNIYNYATEVSPQEGQNIAHTVTEVPLPIMVSSDEKIDISLEAPHESSDSDQSENTHVLPAAGVGSVEELTPQFPEKNSVEEDIPEPTSGMLDSITSIFSGIFGSESPPPENEILPPVVESTTPAYSEVFPREVEVEAVPDGECKTVSGLESECSDAPTPNHLFHFFEKTVPPTSYTALYLIVTSVTVLLFTLGYYFIEQSRRDGPLVAKVNQLTHELQVATSQLQSRGIDTNDEQYIAASNELLELKNAKSKLEEQVEALQMELDGATETGFELNKMVSDLLAQQEGSGSVLKSVEQLQGQLNGQQLVIDNMNRSLMEKSEENKALQNELLAAQEKVEGLEEKLVELRENIEQLLSDKESAIWELESKNTKLESDLVALADSKRKELAEVADKNNNEISELKSTLDEVNKRLKKRESEFHALDTTIKQLQGQSQVDVKAIYDVGLIKAELDRTKSENETLQERLEDEEGARKLLEDHVKKVDVEVGELRTSFQAAEKDKIDAETRLTVLSKYFKEKEAHLQKELGLQEAMWVQKQGDDTTVYERMKSLQEEVESYNFDSLQYSNEGLSVTNSLSSMCTDPPSSISNLPSISISQEGNDSQSSSSHALKPSSVDSPEQRSLPITPTPKPRLLKRRKSSADFEARLGCVESMITQKSPIIIRPMPEDLIKLQELQTVRASPFRDTSLSPEPISDSSTAISNTLESSSCSFFNLVDKFQKSKSPTRSRKSPDSNFSFDSSSEYALTKVKPEEFKPKFSVLVDKFEKLRQLANKSFDEVESDIQPSVTKIEKTRIKCSELVDKYQKLKSPDPNFVFDSSAESALTITRPEDIHPKCSILVEKFENTEPLTSKKLFDDVENDIKPSLTESEETGIKCSDLVNKFENIKKSQLSNLSVNFPLTDKKEAIEDNILINESIKRSNFYSTGINKENIVGEKIKNIDNLLNLSDKIVPFNNSSRVTDIEVPYICNNIIDTPVESSDCKEIVLQTSPSRIQRISQSDKSDSEDSQCVNKQCDLSTARLEFDIKVVANASSKVKKIKKKSVRQKNGAQNEVLKKEIIDQERGLKGRIASLEKKAHESWVAARQAERRLDESKQEAGQLRNMITLIEKSNVTEADGKITPRHTSGDLNGDSLPPLLSDGTSPLPLPPLNPSMLPPGFMPPFMPPPIDGFLPPPPFLPGDHRPPPLGRMSSPPLNRYSPNPVDYSYDRLSSPPPLSPPERDYRSPPVDSDRYPRSPLSPWQELSPRSSFRPVTSHRDSQQSYQGSNPSSVHSSSESLHKPTKRMDKYSKNVGHSKK